MENRILYVYFGVDRLPYKDPECQVHFPNVGSVINGASNVDTIVFDVSNIGGTNGYQYVSVATLPNGNKLYKLLSGSNNQVSLSISQEYTTQSGDLTISINSYQGGSEITVDEETDIISVEGSPIIVATGSIKLSVAYTPTMESDYNPVSEITVQEALALVSTKADQDYVDETFATKVELIENAVPYYEATNEDTPISIVEKYGAYRLINLKMPNHSETILCYFSQLYGTTYMFVGLKLSNCGIYNLTMSGSQAIVEQENAMFNGLNYCGAQPLYIDRNLSSLNLSTIYARKGTTPFIFWYPSSSGDRYFMAQVRPGANNKYVFEFEDLLTPVRYFGSADGSLTYSDISNDSSYRHNYLTNDNAYTKIQCDNKYGVSLVVDSDYKVYLKDANGNTLSTIDLPLESVVVSGSYDDTNKKIVLTLQDGSTIDIPVGDLVSGLATTSELESGLATKVDKVVGKGLSTNDFTDADKTKLDNSATTSDLASKQDTLVSGTNIKTINNESILGSGNITIQGGGGSWGSITGDIQDQTDLQNELQDIREEAEGKTQTFTLSYLDTVAVVQAYLTANPDKKIVDESGNDITSDFLANEYSGIIDNSIFNSQSASLTPTTPSYLLVQTASGVALPSGAMYVLYDITKIKTGDNVYILETDVPDRWFRASDLSFRVLETQKVDLTNYMTTNTDQTISGTKTFTNESPIVLRDNQATIINGDPNGYNSRLHFQGGSQFLFEKYYGDTLVNYIMRIYPSQITFDSPTSVVSTTNADLGTSTYKNRPIYAT